MIGPKFCPYCASAVVRVESGNRGQLFVGEILAYSNEIFDLDITMYQCLSDPTHGFYADDQEENKQ